LWNHLPELVASLSGLCNLLLIIRGRPVSWLVGIIPVTLYFIIFLKVRLYAHVALQVFFLVLQGYGLWQWLSTQPKTGELIVRTLNQTQQWILAIQTLILYGLIGWMLQYTDSTLIWQDALIAALSLTAEWLMDRHNR
jgi:nicotinamide mononucleotide transporter